MVLDRAEQGHECIEVPLRAPDGVQAGSGAGVPRLRRFDPPLPHGLRGHRKHPRRAPDADAFGQACDAAHEEVAPAALAIEHRSRGLGPLAAATGTVKLAPRPPVGLTVRTQIAQTGSAPIRAGGMRTAMLRGSPCGQRPRGCSTRPRGASARATSGPPAAVRRKAGLVPWVGPCTPVVKWADLPRFSGGRMIRSLQVHDRISVETAWRAWTPGARRQPWPDSRRSVSRCWSRASGSQFFNALLN